MSRVKKSRSLKRIAGVKTGTKERTKIERKRRKEAKKASNPRKSDRQKSLYQRFLDDNGIVNQAHVEKPKTKKPENIDTIDAQESTQKPSDKASGAHKEKDQNLWDMLEKPNLKDTY